MNRVKVLASVTTLAALVLVTAVHANDLKAAISKLAGDIKDGKGDPKAAVKAADDTLEDVMYLLRGRRSIKIGELQDLEKLVANIQRDGAPKTLLAKGKDLEDAGYTLAAIARVSEHLPNDKGKKDKKAWKDFTDHWATAAIDFAKAGKAGDGTALKNASLKIHESCSKCHSKFK